MQHDGYILPARCMKKMPPSVQLREDQTKISAYNGTEIKQQGVLEVECTFNGRTSTEKFHVVEGQGPSTGGTARV